MPARFQLKYDGIIDTDRPDVDLSEEDVVELLNQKEDQAVNAAIERCVEEIHLQWFSGISEQECLELLRALKTQDAAGEEGSDKIAELECQIQQWESSERELQEGLSEILEYPESEIDDDSLAAHFIFLVRRALLASDMLPTPPAAKEEIDG